MELIDTILLENAVLEQSKVKTVAVLDTITAPKLRTMKRIAQLTEGTGASSLICARKDSASTTMEIHVLESKRLQMEIGAQLLTTVRKVNATTSSG